MKKRRTPLNVPVEMVEAGVARLRTACRLGIDDAKVADHRLHGGVKAVEIQAVEADLVRIVPARVVGLPQPADDISGRSICQPGAGWSVMSPAELLRM